MKKKKKIIINLLIIGFSLLVYMIVTGAGFTPAMAHKRQERTINYGPSQIVKVVEKGASRFFLGQFNGYYSCSMVERGRLGLWYGARKGMWGMEIKEDKPINFHHLYIYDDNQTFDELYVYGVINDERVKRIKLEFYLDDGGSKLETLTIEIGADEIFDNMFFSIIEKKGMKEYVVQKSIRAFNEAGQLIFEEDPNAVIYEERYEG
ncbi:MAG: hypothetical protein ACOYJ1_11080 [Peptococcales bacterium]|jgi:hypothetical protein